MADLIWTDAALEDLNRIAAYIALESPANASKVVQRIFQRVRQLADHPESGPRLPELKNSAYRQLLSPPYRIIYLHADAKVSILHIVHEERLLRPSLLRRRFPN